MAAPGVLSTGTCGGMFRPTGSQDAFRLPVRYRDPLPTNGTYQVKLSPMLPGMHIEDVTHEGFTLVLPGDTPPFMGVYIVREAAPRG